MNLLLLVGKTFVSYLSLDLSVRVSVPYVFELSVSLFVWSCSSLLVPAIMLMLSAMRRMQISLPTMKLRYWWSWRVSSIMFSKKMLNLIGCRGTPLMNDYCRVGRGRVWEGQRKYTLNSFLARWWYDSFLFISVRLTSSVNGSNIFILNFHAVKWLVNKKHHPVTGFIRGVKDKHSKNSHKSCWPFLEWKSGFS